jgi:transposase
MNLLYERCCGLDVHKDTVVSCLRLASDRKVTTEVRTFKTTTAALLQLSAWLTANNCTHVAMEATGVYWKPVWHILDDGEFELVLANAAHVKNVPGRKTDVNDAMWLAELLAHGLIRSSFVPDTQTQEMRSLLRTRKQLIREQSSHMLRVQKTLEDANIKLDSVLSDLMGQSGRAMIEALIAGETNPAKLASLANRRVRASQEELREALRGRVTKNHRCAFISIRLTLSMQPSPRLTHKWRGSLDPFGPQSSESCRSRVSRISAPKSSSPRSGPT